LLKGPGMSIAVNCDACQKWFAVAEKHAGKLIRCPGCKQPMRVGTTSGITKQRSGQSKSSRSGKKGSASRSPSQAKTSSSGEERRRPRQRAEPVYEDSYDFDSGHDDQPFEDYAPRSQKARKAARARVQRKKKNIQVALISVLAVGVPAATVLVGMKLYNMAGASRDGGANVTATAPEQSTTAQSAPASTVETDTDDRHRSRKNIKTPKPKAVLAYWHWIPSSKVTALPGWMIPETDLHDMPAAGFTTAMRATCRFTVVQAPCSLSSLRLCAARLISNYLIPPVGLECVLIPKRQWRTRPKPARGSIVYGTGTGRIPIGRRGGWRTSVHPTWPESFL